MVWRLPRSLSLARSSNKASGKLAVPGTLKFFHGLHRPLAFPCFPIRIVILEGYPQLRFRGQGKAIQEGLEFGEGRIDCRLHVFSLHGRSGYATYPAPRSPSRATLSAVPNNTPIYPLGWNGNHRLQFPSFPLAIFERKPNISPQPRPSSCGKARHIFAYRILLPRQVFSAPGIFLPIWGM